MSTAARDPDTLPPVFDGPPQRYFRRTGRSEDQYHLSRIDLLIGADTAGALDLESITAAVRARAPSVAEAVVDVRIMPRYENSRVTGYRATGIAVVRKVW